MMVSILGDSISTFEGYNPDGYAVYYDKRVQFLNGIHSVYDTWWAKVNQSLHAYLCVNNSYSGSTVTGVAFPSGGSDQRCSGLHTQLYQPDMILVYLGINDFGKGIPPFRKRISIKKDRLVFYDAYAYMLDKLQTNYPHANIVCGTLVKTKIRDSDWLFPQCFSGVPFDDYNNAIRKACKKADCHLADMDKLNMRLETLDGSHPTAQGHALFAKAWICSFEHLGIIQVTSLR